MKRISYRLVNAITFYRLAAAPLLIVLLVIEQLQVFKWLLAFSFLTDAVDGWLARRFRVVSLMGARVDSVADDLTVFVAILGLSLYHTDFLYSEWPVVATLVVCYLTQNGIALIRFHKLTSFHTYAAKIAAVLQGIFLVSCYFFEAPVSILFYVAAGCTLLDLAEETVLVLLLDKWEADVKGIYWVLKRKGS